MKHDAVYAIVNLVSSKRKLHKTSSTPVLTLLPATRIRNHATLSNSVDPANKFFLILVIFC